MFLVFFGAAVSFLHCSPGKTRGGGEAEGEGGKRECEEKEEEEEGEEQRRDAAGVVPTGIKHSWALTALKCWSSRTAVGIPVAAWSDGGFRWEFTGS